MLPQGLQEESLRVQFEYMPFIVDLNADRSGRHGALQLSHSTQDALRAHRKLVDPDSHRVVNGRPDSTGSRQHGHLADALCAEGSGEVRLFDYDGNDFGRVERGGNHIRREGRSPRTTVFQRVVLGQAVALAHEVTAFDLALDIGHVDSPADVVRGYDSQYPHVARIWIDFQLDDLAAEAIAEARPRRLSVRIEREGLGGMVGHLRYDRESGFRRIRPEGTELLGDFQG